MHRLLTPTTTSFCLMRAPGLASRYDRQPDGGATITAIRYDDGDEVQVLTEQSTLTFDEVLAEIATDDEVFGVRA
jgi:hypothetical protein